MALSSVILKSESEAQNAETAVAFSFNSYHGVVHPDEPSPVFGYLHRRGSLPCLQELLLLPALREGRREVRGL